MKRRAFTLPELLTVLAIVAVLAALAAPSLLHFMSEGRQAKCASNLRQIGTALLLFAGDHDGDFPETTHTTGTKFRRAWIFTLRAYLANCDAVRVSPADPQASTRLRENGTSYILNSWVFVPNYDPFGNVGESFANLRRLPLPGHSILAFNISDQQAPSVLNDHTHGDLWGGNWLRVCADIQPNCHRSGADTASHLNGSSNILFADGHVDVVPAEVLKKRVEEGLPLGKPPIEPADIISLRP